MDEPKKRINSQNDLENSSLVSENKEATPLGPLKNNKKKFLKLGLILIFLIASGVGLAFYFQLIEMPSPAKNKEAKANEPAKEISVGPMIKLSPLIINLNETEGRHFLKVTLVLEAEQAKFLEEIQAKTSQITNMIIIHLSDKKLADIHQRDAKENLKKELLEK
ncbi:MAG: flagellar basal body-associated FliL family protein, partial [bacterium]